MLQAGNRIHLEHDAVARGGDLLDVQGDDVDARQPHTQGGRRRTHLLHDLARDGLPHGYAHAAAADVGRALDDDGRSLRRSGRQAKALPLESEEAIEVDGEGLHPLRRVRHEAAVVLREHELLDRRGAVADDLRPAATDDVQHLAVEQEEAELLADCLTLDDEPLRRSAGAAQRALELRRRLYRRRDAAAGSAPARRLDDDRGLAPARNERAARWSLRRTTRCSGTCTLARARRS